MAVELNAPYFEGGINNAHFFNGRVLTAEALQDDQTANRMHRGHLARAIGEGILYGLEVTKEPAGEGEIAKTLAITKGMALNRNGQTLVLPHDITLAMAPETETAGPPAADVFVPCEEILSTLIATGKGVYILTAVPISRFDSKTALLHGLADNGAASGCGYKYEQEGVRFRLVKIDLSPYSDEINTLFNTLQAGTGGSSLSRFRNLLAHTCLGTPDKIRFLQDPFNVSAADNPSFDRYGAADALRPAPAPGREYELTDCDVPLALVFWAENGIEFADMWSVRRGVHVPTAVNAPPFPAMNRRTAEAEAAFFQFRDQLQTLFRSPSDIRLDTQVRAKDFFRYLPAVGMIPLDNFETDKTKRNIDIKFFEDLTHRDPVFMEGMKARRLISASFSYPAIDLEEKELIWLYRVRENMQFFEDNGEKQGQAYLVFSSGYIPFRGEAQYDLSRFDYGNYGPGVADTFIIGG
jgi:hypothetical protein